MGCSQRSLPGGRDTWAVVWRMSRTKLGVVEGGGEERRSSNEALGRKESNTLEGQGGGQCVWNTGAEGVSVVMMLGEIMQGPYRSYGRIFLSTLREWEKPLKCFKQVSEGIWGAFWKGHPFHGEWVGRGEMCIRRDYLGDGSPDSGRLALGGSSGKRWSGSITCFRGQINLAWQGEACKLAGRFCCSEPGTLEATELGKKITTWVRNPDWPLPNCRTLVGHGASTHLSSLFWIIEVNSYLVFFSRSRIKCGV